MRRTIILCMAMMALLWGCQARDENILLIEEQGSFAVGGSVMTDSSSGIS